MLARRLQLLFLLKTLFFKAVLSLKNGEGGRDFSHTFAPTRAQPAYPVINITHQNDTFFFFFIKDEPTLTQHDHPKPTVYIRVHSWCWIFYGSEQVYNNKHPPHRIMQSIFTVLKILFMAPPIHLFP